MTIRFRDIAEELSPAKRQYLINLRKSYASALKRDRCRSARDGRTGFYRPEIFEEFLSQYSSRAKRDELPFTLALADIDFFKRVNDNYGHPVGNSVLEKFASEVRKVTRPYDPVGRVGGEEFGILYSEGSDKILIPLERLRLAIEDNCVFYFDRDKRILLEDSAAITAQAAGAAVEKFSITISVGFATASHDILNPLELYRRADQALYRAKRTGRNKVVSFADMCASD